MQGTAHGHADGGAAEWVEGIGETRIWAVAAPASETGPRTCLHLMLGLSKHDLVADSWRRRRQDLLILSGVALLLFAGVWSLAELGIRRQVGRITTMVRTLGASDLRTRIALPYPRGELGAILGNLSLAHEEALAGRPPCPCLGP